ncbi:hypothetical protein [Candidatus Pseudothioglobus singularis]|uniref:Uncharacterized protein n=1 Tax=Candidatus Pseudothioglobus singularis PS1 TaxID=1125411 RepID=A0A0M3T2C8_9GAMM|nr:hypothetical protein [Candidatus Pseudothioglobus singularis]ALE02621.1 hypothetical protein W908_02005 [Candidatus Pseudothioglobus singularis PS1]
MTKVFNSFSILFLLLFFSSVGFAGGDDTSALQEELDMVLMEELNPCFDQLEGDINDDSNITSVIKLSGLGAFNQGDEIMSSSNVKAIVESYDPKTNQLTYYQTAKTGFRSFSIGEKLVGKGSNVLTIEELVLDFVVPCSDLIVSIEEDPGQMIFIFADSEAAIKAKLAAAEMMAEIEAEMARAAALKAFQDKLAADKAAAAAATAAYRDALLEAELAAFEAQVAAEEAAAEMMAEIEEEMARQAALDAFLLKLKEEKAAAASSTAAYQAKLAYEKRVTKIMDDLLVELEDFNLSGEYKSTISDELIKEATIKLEEEAFVGTISGEIVTEAIHDFCKVNLGLSESNIELFKKALAGGYLGNVGPQSNYGTEFTANRWQKYIDCVGSKR